MSGVCRHPPPDTLSDKDTCDSSLCRLFIWSSLLEAGLLRVISAPCTEITSPIKTQRRQRAAGRKECEVETSCLGSQSGDALLNPSKPCRLHHCLIASAWALHLPPSPPPSPPPHDRRSSFNSCHGEISFSPRGDGLLSLSISWPENIFIARGCDENTPELKT